MSHLTNLVHQTENSLNDTFVKEGLIDGFWADDFDSVSGHYDWDTDVLDRLSGTLIGRCKRMVIAGVKRWCKENHRTYMGHWPVGKGHRIRFEIGH